MWKDDFEMLSSQEQDRFRKVTNYLLNKTFVLREIYEPRDRIGKINGDYRFIERNFDLFSDFLDIAGYKLNKDDTRGIISVINEYGYNSVRLDKFTTLFLLAIRFIYDSNMESSSNASKNVCFTSVSEVNMMLLDKKLITRKPTIKETVDAIRTLSKFNVIGRIDGAIDDLGSTYVIYPSIVKVISNEKISSIYATMFQDQKIDEKYSFEESEVK